MNAIGVLPILALLAASLLTQPAGAQKNKNEPERPKLQAGVDTNDAASYFNYGMARETPWKKAYPAFQWARRLDPLESYYVFAQYRASWGRQSREWQNAYFDGAGYVVKSKEAALIDTLFYESLIRDPFAHFTGCVVYTDLDISDPVWLGIIHYENQCWRQAADNLALAIKKRPKNLMLREYRARALYFLREYGNAASEFQGLIAALSERDSKSFQRFYQSKEMYEYMLGLTYLADQKYTEAREALGRALTENLAFYMAHDKLASVALAQADIETAVSEMDLAVQLKPEEPALRHRFGYALLQTKPRRNEEAEVQFRKAIELEPFFALAYYNLAVALENQGKKTEAIAQYQAYLTRAPRRQKAMIADAEKKVAKLFAEP